MIDNTYTYDDKIKELATVFMKKDKPLTERELSDLKIPKLNRKIFIKMGVSWEEAKTDAWILANELKESDLGTSIDNKGDVIRHQRNIINDLLKEKRTLQKFTDVLEESLSVIDFPKIRPPKPSTKKLEDEFMGINVSDSHIGTNITLSDMSGIGDYNFDIFLEEMDVFKGKVKTFIDIYRSSANINKIVINFLGDVVEGEGIFPTQHNYVDKVVIDQVLLGVMHFTEFILWCNTIAPNVEVFAIPGNHGRVSKVAHHRVNWDYIAYTMMQIILARYPNIDMYVSNCPCMIVKHGKHNIYLEHGGNIKGWMSLPFYGITRQMAYVSHMYGIDVSYYMLAHHHQAASVPFSRSRTLVNGSWVGGSPYSVGKMQQADLPIQLCYRFHPEHGLNNLNEIRLREWTPLVPDKKGIYTPLAKSIGEC